MARHKRETPVQPSDLEKARKQVLMQFFGLSEKALHHLSVSLEAKMPCNSCFRNVDDTWVVKVSNASGQCVICENTRFMPDKEQRNWAADRVLDRAAPKPKPVELALDDKRGLEDFERDLSEKPTDVVNNLAAQLGVVLESEPDS